MAQQYPALSDFPFSYLNSPESGANGRMLESWPVGEPGSPSDPRPPQLPMDQFGVQNFSPDTTPRDLAGDIVSHELVNSDPEIRKNYQEFVKTFANPEGMARLKQDYAWSQQNEGEQRPIMEWAQTSRFPAYMRAYVFSQWPNADKAFSPAQKKILDRIKSRVNAPRKSDK